MRELNPAPTPLSSESIAPYDLHGQALLDCFGGEKDAVLICHQDGLRDDVPARFWLRKGFDDMELAMLDQCRGRVLDLGAGAGLHALELQRRGLEVVAIDVAQQCVAVAQARGVLDARCADLFTFDDGRFDTIACFCNGLDKVGRLADLPRFLDRMRRLLTPGGQLLADSFDLRLGADAAARRGIARKMASGRYFGEIDLMFEYKGRISAPFTALHVDFSTLAEIAERQGWRCERLRAAGGHYLVRACPAG